MDVFNRRNALVGWIVLRVARRKLERGIDTLLNGHTRRRRLAAALGVGAATATTVGLYGRRSRSAPALGA